MAGPQILERQQEIHETVLQLLDTMVAALPLLRDVDQFVSVAHLKTSMERAEGIMRDTVNFVEKWADPHRHESRSTPSTRRFSSSSFASQVSYLPLPGKKWTRSRVSKRALLPSSISLIVEYRSNRFVVLTRFKHCVRLFFCHLSNTI